MVILQLDAAPNSHNEVTAIMQKEYPSMNACMIDGSKVATAVSKQTHGYTSNNFLCVPKRYAENLMQKHNLYKSQPKTKYRL